MRKLLPWLLCLACMPAMAGLVQKVNNHAASATSVTCTLSGVAANDTLIAVFGGGTSEALGSIADTPSGNAVSSGVPYGVGSSSVGLGIYYVQAAASGSHTITVSFATAQNITCFLAEYSGLAVSGVFDKASAISFNTTTSVTTPSITPAGSGELVIFGVIQSQASNSFSAFGSYTQQDSYNALGPSGTWASFVTGSSTSGAATSTTADIWQAAVAVFKPALGAANFVISNGHALMSNGKPVVIN